MSIKDNTMALQALLEQANTLPDAGSGGAVEKISVVLTSEVEGMECRYFDGSEYKSIDFPYFDSVTIEPVANSAIFIGMKESSYINWYTIVSDYDAVTTMNDLFFMNDSSCRGAFLVQSDCEIVVYEYEGGLEGI